MAMSLHLPISRRLLQLWQASDLVLLGQRRERRMRILASLGMILVGLIWGTYFSLLGIWAIAAMDLAMILSGLAVLMLFGLLHIMQSDTVERSALEIALREAIREQQFVLHCQPQLDAEGRVFGAEVLIRWQHPQRGLLSPAEFIDHAEKTGLILPIGKWVLREACRQLQEWEHQAWGKGLSLAINISQKQFRQRNFVAEILTTVGEFNIPPRQIELELTETLIVQDLDDLLRKMEALVQHEIRFSLDDFGTGYSSLSHLKRLPLHKLKVDRTFVTDVLNDNSSKAIVRSVIALGQSMGMEVIAEGVESIEQQKFLAQHGCTQYQGYLFSKPLAADDFARFVQQHNGISG